MKNVFKKFPRTACVIILIVILLVSLGLVSVVSNKHPVTKITNIMQKMFYSGETYSITISDENGILSEVLVNGNSKTKQYKIQKENFDDSGVKYPFILVADNESININVSKKSVCDIRGAYSYISTKAYSKDAFVDTREERGYYTIIKTTEEQKLMMDSINNILNSFATKENVYSYIYDFLYYSGVFSDINDKELLSDTFRACCDDFTVWLQNDAFEEFVEYNQEHVSGGSKTTFNINEEAQLRAIQFFEPFYNYIKINDEEYLNEEYIKYSLIDLSISVTIIDNEISEIEYKDVDAGHVYKITISKHEDFTPNVITHNSYVTEMDFQKSDYFHGESKQVDTEILENAKTIYTSDEFNVKFLSMYTANITNETMGLLCIDGKLDKNTELKIENITLDGQSLGNVSYVCLEYNDAKYISFVIPDEYCDKNNIDVNIDLLLYNDNSGKSEKIPIDFVIDANSKRL